MPIPTKALVVFAGLLAVCMAHAADGPPAARMVPVVDRPFGLTMPDPYRWMEGENNAELQAWLQAQGAFTRTQLDASPTLVSWRQRMQAATATATVNRLQRRVAGRLFFLRAEGDRRGVLMLREADGRERSLLDPNALGSGGKPASVTEFSPSPDGRIVAVNVDVGGAEITTVSLIDVDTGATRPESFDAIWGEFPVVWFADGRGFSYTQMAPKPTGTAAVDPMLNMRVRMHRLGQPVQDDPVVLAAGANPGFPLKPEEFPIMDAGNLSDWAIATASGARPETRLCAAPKARALAPGAAWTCLVDYTDGVQSYALRGSVLYLLSVKGAPKGRVLALDLNVAGPRLAAARVVLPESRSEVLTGLALARDGLYVRGMTNGIDRLIRMPFDGSKPDPVFMPLQGAIFQMDADRATDGLIFTLQSWTQPRLLFAFDPAARSMADLQLGATSPGDYSGIVAMETEARSADGTRVPLSIIYRQDQPRDGRALAIVNGYGGYGISIQPYFSATVLEWVKAGHVYAYAHVRGGGEKGSAWWRGGKGPLKHKGVDDFIACADQLAQLRFSSHERLAASGASNGGLLVGGAITAAPKAFGAAAIHAGMLNPVRLLSAPNGANQIAEVGDPRTASGLRTLKAMDPYQRVRDGMGYPAVLLAVGLNDSRVSPWESAKFAARLTAATRSGKPVWLRTSGSQGHFSGSLTDQADELADTYTFFEDQLSGR